MRKQRSQKPTFVLYREGKRAKKMSLSKIIERMITCGAVSWTENVDMRKKVSAAEKHL
jgi:hypothetical protein